MAVIPTSTNRPDMGKHGIEKVPRATTCREPFQALPYRQVTAASRQGSHHLSDSVESTVESPDAFTSICPGVRERAARLTC